jgi:hypothetical protein
MDWRSSAKKNHQRDYVKYAIAEILERSMVKKYRADLLKKSSAAAYLRQALVDIWSPHTQTRLVKYIEEKNSVTYTGWVYPDFIPLPSTQVTEAPPVNVQRLAEYREQNSIEAEDRRAVAAYIQKGQTLAAFKATPDSPYLNDRIRELLDEVVIVCVCNLHTAFIIGIPLSYLLYMQEASKTVRVHTNMRKAKGTAESQGKKLDLDPKNFQVKKKTVPVIVYKRIDGWTEHKEVRTGQSNMSI